MVALAGGALVVCFVMMRLSRQRRGQAAAQGRPMSARDQIRQEAGVSGRVDDMMVQLAELARTTTAQIETRYTKLEVLLEDADKKIARLESLLAAGGTTGAVNSAAAETVRPEHARIHALADSGKSAVQIAGEVGRDVGEVELILALRRRNQG